MYELGKHGPREPVSAAVIAQLLVPLAAPGAADHLLRQHVADERGHCRGCELPQSGSTGWPCTTRAIAVAMRDQAGVPGHQGPDPAHRGPGRRPAGRGAAGRTARATPVSSAHAKKV
jgi:hypothetical protein